MRRRAVPMNDRRQLELFARCAAGPPKNESATERGKHGGRHRPISGETSKISHSTAAPRTPVFLVVRGDRGEFQGLVPAPSIQVARARLMAEAAQ